MSFITGTLSGRQWQELAQALRTSFPTVARLRMMVQYGLNENLDEFVPSNADTQEATFELIRWAQAQGRLGELILAARNANPGNPQLRNVAEDVSLAPNSRALESVFTPGTALVSVEEWRTKMSLAELAVCRIEIAGVPRGTGFLLGACFVLTNHHVLQPLFDGAEPDTLVCRFDYKASADGMTLSRGVEYRVADNWLVDRSPVQELDYGLLCLKKPAGDLPISNQTGAPPRGWLRPNSHKFEKGERLFIIQHPNATPMKLGIGTVERISEDRNRICHDADTEPGSSGSPCFTIEWKLVGLHQHGQGFSQYCRKNGAINVASIVSQPKVQALAIV
jgi:V8-like Glu-specific endopeptidase